MKESSSTNNKIAIMFKRRVPIMGPWEVLRLSGDIAQCTREAGVNRRHRKARGVSASEKSSC